MVQVKDILLHVLYKISKLWKPIIGYKINCYLIDLEFLWLLVSTHGNNAYWISSIEVHWSIPDV